MNKKCFFVCFCMIFVIVSCGSEDVGNHKVINVIEVDNNNSMSVLSADEYLDLVKISISAEDVLRIGGAVRDFIPLDGKIVLIDRYKHVLTAIDLSGNVLWQLEGKNNDHEVFASVNVVNYNIYSGQIEVYDDLSHQLYLFDIDGRFINRRSEPANFLDRIPINAEYWVYDLMFAPKAFRDEDGTVYNYGVSKDGVSFDKLSVNNNWKPGRVPYMTFENFSTVDDQVFHHHSFQDTVYKVGLESSEPAYVFRFSHGESAQEVIIRNNVERPFAHIYEENLSYPLQSVPVNGRVYSMYRSSQGRALAINDLNSGESLLNTRYLSLDNELIPPPIKYRNGYFLSMIYDSQKDELDAAMKSDAFPEDFDPKSIKFVSPDSDVEGLEIVLIKPKMK